MKGRGVDIESHVHEQNLPWSALSSRTFWAVAAGTAMCDLLSKEWARHALTVGQPWPTTALPRLRLALNANLNAGLTLFGGGYALYSMLGLLAIIVLMIAVARTPRSARTYVLGFALALGGGVGNVGERIIRRAVTDFLDFGHGSFNVADIAVVIGLFTYLIARLCDGGREHEWRAMTLRDLVRPAGILPPSLRRPRGGDSRGPGE